MSEYLETETIIEELQFEGNPVTLKSPGMDGFGHFLTIAKDLSKAGKDIDPEKMMSYFTTDSINAISCLIKLTLKKTFKDRWSDDKDLIEVWALENSVILMQRVMEMCSPKTSHEQSKKDQLMTRIQNEKSTGNKE